ncbi:GyrI-like domain-containing protein [Salirhabdus sp. Marseille-P4669]|uniref:GyrI-like domain-containing protein n=1 Tax=Salirhabdus sp. Marseille-P4669 TaxID=2042310 RepID=UPI000C7BEEBF|nr:GyrI-like domain-containing protein [Salirhabdus sp. Marseille-P4669]
MSMKTKLDSENYTWTSAAQAIYALLQYTDKKSLTLSEVMGYSTHAFRMNIHPESVSPAGTTMFDPLDLVPRGLKTLGILTLIESLQTPLPDKKLADMVRFIQTRLDRGFPVISWDLFAPEFGVIYGYDNEKQVFFAKDVEKDSTIKYSELNERRFNHLFLNSFLHSYPRSIPIMLKEALPRVIEFLKGKSKAAISREYKHGLEGYEAWIQAFNGRKIDAAGNAYNAAVVADARKYACDFFTQLINKWEMNTDLDRQVASYLQEGERIYGKVAEIIDDLPRMFPFPHGGEPNAPINAQRAIELLQAAHKWEKEGLKVLTGLLGLVEQYEDDTFMIPYKVGCDFEFVGQEFKGSLANLDKEVSKNMKAFLKQDQAIETKIINVRLIAYETNNKEGENTCTYLVARPVYFEPDEIPIGMKFIHSKNEYGYIRTKTFMLNKGYEKLRQWMDDNGYEVDNDSYTIERFLPIPHPTADEEVEIYIPLHS